MAESKTYGKTALIDDITASTQGCSRKAVAEIVDAALDTIAIKVASGQNVTLTGFGTFRKAQRSARMGTNIRTGQKIQIPASTGVRFTPGSELKAAVSGKAKERGRLPGICQAEDVCPQTVTPAELYRQRCRFTHYLLAQFPIRIATA